MGVATWKTPVQPAMASSKLPSSLRSALQMDSRSLAPGSSSNGFVFSTFPETKEINKCGDTAYVRETEDGEGESVYQGRARWPGRRTPPAGAS
jgi:hypothetical protein